MNAPSGPTPETLPVDVAQFVRWFREVAPYVHAYRGKTFVVGVVGELVQAGGLNALVQDLSLMQALGIRIVLVHGSRPQVNAQMHLKGLEGEFDRGLRITTPAALECAKEASGEIRLDIEAAFSQGLPNTPMAHARIRVISGNFVTARPVGVIDGVDFQHTGRVRKVDAEAIRLALDQKAVVLLSPLGFSPTGEAFNLAMEEVATSVAVALRADKLIFMTEGELLQDAQGQAVTEITRVEAQALLHRATLPESVAEPLKHACQAVQYQVDRAHLLPFSLDGSVLLEVFTHDGVGTMVVEDTLDDLRAATIDDIGGIVQLIEPLEADGTLVRRGPGRVERDIDSFSVAEHDRVIYGCVAVYPFASKRMAEMACLTVHPEWQGAGAGEKLLRHAEARARALGMQKLFVLTTRTAHWFLKRGFMPAKIEDLPTERQEAYDPARRSLVFVKRL